MPLSGVGSNKGGGWGEHLSRRGSWDSDMCRALSREPGLWPHLVRGTPPPPVSPRHFLTLGPSLLSGSSCTPGQVLSESDLDNDNMLSFSEFEHAMAKSPDFMK